MKQYDIAIVGGGVAGYFAAIKLLEKNDSLNILLLEKETEPLKKLLTTGSGACNFTHEGSIDDFLLRYGKNGQFLRNAFYTFFVKDIVSFFEHNGINTTCRDDGKYFPKSMKASEIKEFFIKLTKNVDIKLHCSVNDITKEGDSFTVSTQKGLYNAKNVLITTGGKSFPKTGSTGDGYIFAKKLGHTIIDTKPALASVFCKNHELSNLSGISFSSVKISHCVNNKTQTFTGPLLITHKGYSGPVIIDNARNFIQSEALSISFILEKKEALERALREKPTETLLNALKNYAIPKKMIQLFSDISTVDCNKKICEISTKKIQALIMLLTDYHITISSVEGFETCMCTAGGVSLKEINPKTFESKVLEGLYFLGEVLDIDGDSGGYNLQAIWSECALFAENFY